LITWLRFPNAVTIVAEGAGSWHFRSFSECQRNNTLSRSRRPHVMFFMCVCASSYWTVCIQQTTP